MKPLPDLLVQVPAVYAELGRAMVPGGHAGGPPSSPDPVHRPAPGNLEIAEHRHQLLRGLRWWVDAVTEKDGHAPVGESVARMCVVLLHYLPSMAPEDRDELQTNLWDWLGGAMPLVGAVPAPSAPRLPRAALDRVVPVHVAAEALAVSVSTVKYRTVGKRTGGRVLIRDAAGPLCVMSDLPRSWCAHCERA